MWKLVQKQVYDVLSNKQTAIVITLGVCLVLISAFQFGEVALEWSSEKYAAVFNSFSDNVAGKSFQSRLCMPVPIDVVYTWVNGSDTKLLAQLHAVKQEMEGKVSGQVSNSSAGSGNTSCAFSNCIPTNWIVLEPPIPGELSLDRLSLLYPTFKAASKMFLLNKTDKEQGNVTVIVFDNPSDMEAALHERVSVSGKNVTIKPGFLTTDWTLSHSILLHDTVLMTGFPDTYDTEDITKKINATYTSKMTKIELFKNEGILMMTLPDKPLFESFLDSNVTIDNKKSSLNAANLVWEMKDTTLNEEFGSNRFEDNEELRYSLRSIERHAPWVRHVYLVTNGQIPSWLNLDSPRLTLVTHEDIFPNKSHLPTFSSPAIESHLHRIPGLSEKFIYLNDDVMFGKDVWPEDFYTHARGQKVYQSWPVPSCQEGCPSTWIQDGYCDKACNNSECEYDGGDCLGGGRVYGDTIGGGHGVWGVDDGGNCNSGCVTSWIADHYCDASCNVKQCGFDAGDCGPKDFHQLHAVQLNHSITHYRLPKGEIVAYFNWSDIFGPDGRIESATYEKNSAIRAAAVTQQQYTVTLLLLPEKNATTLNFTLNGVSEGKNNESLKSEFNFLVDVDTLPQPVQEAGTHENETLSKGVNGTDGKGNHTEVKFVFPDIAKELQRPTSVIRLGDIPPVQQVNMSDYLLPDNISLQFENLKQQHSDGDLTDFGFKQRQSALWDYYITLLKKDGKAPVRAPPRLPVAQNKTESNVGRNETSKHVVAENALDKSKFDSYLQRGADKVLNRDNSHVEVGGGLNAVEEKQTQKEDQKSFKMAEANPVVLEADRIVNGSKVDKKIVKTPDDISVKMKNKHAQALKENGKSDKNIKNNQKRSLKSPDAPRQPLDVAKMQADIGPVRKGGGNVNDSPNGINQNIGQGVAIKDVNIVPGGNETVVKNKSSDSYVREKFKSRKLNSVDSVGFLPWEKQHLFSGLMKETEAMEVKREYETSDFRKRKVLDTFADSLRHVNRLYNQYFGYSARKVPAHIAHMIDRNVMYELQAEFPEQWDATSRHKIRSSKDMQFAFSYFHYLMSVPANITAGDFFDEMDTDKSGILSDREIRTVATKLYDLPLDLQSLTGLEAKLINCSEHIPQDRLPVVPPSAMEKYYDAKMPQVTKALVVQCPAVTSMISATNKGVTKYKTEVVGEEEIAFKMIRTNVSHVVGQLDDIRKNPKKFICLNDNIDHSKDEAKTVKAVLQDFYESLFPIPSSFELAREYRNRFQHVDELREWRRYRDWLKMWTQLALLLLILFTLGSFFSDKLEALQRRVFGRRPQAAERPHNGVQTV